MSISRNEDLLTEDDDNQENESLNDFKHQLAVQSCTHYNHGYGYINPKHQPEKVNFMFNKKIKFLIVNTHGAYEVFLGTEDGEEYVWNDPILNTVINYDAEFYLNWNTRNIMEAFKGTSNYIQYIPHKVDWSNTRIVKTTTNKNNFLILTDDGKIYYKSIYGDLGTRGIYQMDIKEKIKSIGCGSDFYLIVTNNDKTYSWGLNKIDDLGMPRQLCFQKELCEVTTLSGKTIVKIACGTDHTLALTDKGKVYGWGSNSDGQSNLTSRDCVPYPTMINIPSVKKILDIAAMHNRSFIKSNENGLVYMWGHFANVSIKKPFVCEYTNVFDVFNSMTAQSSMSVVHEFTKEECDILNDLEAAFNDRSTSDLTILVEGQSIYVHKRILKMRCTYFRNMFQTDYIENNQSIINHRHYSYVVYESFLKYLYTGKINLSSIDDLLDLLKLADEVCEKHLEMDCIRTIKKTITVSNIACLINLLNEMAEHHKKELEEYCFKFYLKNMTDVMRTGSFKQLDDETKAIYITKGKEFFDI